MGQGLSCAASDEHGLFIAIQFGDVQTVKAVLESDPSLVKQTTLYDHHSALHVAAANVQIEIVSTPMTHRATIRGETEMASSSSYSFLNK
ncbi:hypothetical protein RHMOL_Rhmol03G0149700 [Rhododendron molle]|uniref:Uncharacterized protein n=1 Tax=Rhododendron molle TaxID=49168 RepID=A0ACC0PE32_RHOML|nr:hypothetical protein RHMOL_Rhmol03G0149700 [Rhododendron molle]